MLHKIENTVRRVFRSITESLAFYPMLIAFGFVVLAIAMLTLELAGLTDWISERVKYISVSDADTARTILSTIIGGVISLTVFSFSMVMLLLNQASSNLSPRVLPGLISNRHNQFVLGFLIGTIVYCIIVTINILPDARSYKVPAISIFLGILFGLSCLGMFVFFIHSISKNIQVGHILKEIWLKTKNELEKQLSDRGHKWTEDIPDTADWKILKSRRTGYVLAFSQSLFMSTVEKEDCRMCVLKPQGSFIVEGSELLAIDKDISEDIEEQLYDAFIFSSEERIADSYVLGIKQITEVIVKAMSPGINDPGTALNGIDYLTGLFGLRLQLPDNEVIKDEAGAERIYIDSFSFQDILYVSLASIRQYVKKDVVVMLRLIEMFRVLLATKNLKSEHRSTLLVELDNIMKDADDNIQNKSDLKKVRVLFDLVSETKAETYLS